jgi:diguanylate cyclase (GGDEF)-like protein
VTPLDLAVRAAAPGTVRVLSIEDHPAYAMLVREQLAAAGAFDVVSVSRLADGIEELARAGADCVLLDLGLPDARGLKALEALRTAAIDVPIVVLSGQDDEELAIRAVQEGAQDYLVKSDVDGRLLSRAIGYAMERKRTEVQLAHQALHDELTGLPNRALLLDRLAHAVTRLGRAPGKLAVLFCDLDRFKVVNDSLGHDAGDELLVAVAERLQDVLRLGDTAARFGGDEFVVLCEDVTGLQDAEEVGARISEALAAPFELSAGDEVYVRLSIGIVLADSPHERAEALVRDADAAMYRAKERGGGTSDVFDGELRRHVVRRLEVENALHRAIERDELDLHFQPLLRLAGGAVHGVEALVRWRHPERGLISPAEFIPAAEATGLIIELGEWVFERACRTWVAWGRPDVTVSVNLSARQCAHAALPATFDRIVTRTGADPLRLCLEVTETAVMADASASSDVLAEVKALGLRLAIDDFGTGYSSLRALQRFPFDEVKIDRSFVDGLQRDASEAAIVRAVISLSRDLGLATVAEGIETRSQRDMLHALGCDIGQGFLFARPCPADELAALLA